MLMSFQRLFAIALAIGATSVGVLTPQVAESAPRRIFGSSPQAIEQFFGPYWSRLTEPAGNGKSRVTYRYSPGKLYNVFIENNKIRLNVIFIDNKAESVEIWGDLKWTPQRQDQLAAYLLGTLDTRHPLYRKLISQSDGSGTLQGKSYCYGEGIMLSYEYAGSAEMAHYALLSRNPKCNAPKKQ